MKLAVGAPNAQFPAVNGVIKGSAHVPPACAFLAITSKPPFKSSVFKVLFDCPFDKA